MQNNGKNSSESIAEILNMIKADTDSKHVDEFVFGGKEQDPVLVFDDSDEPEVSEPTPAPVVSVDFESRKEEPPLELFVPEKFEVSEKYDTPEVFEEAPRLYTTYVPRFTEVSEQYRMKNDPRPVPKKEKTVIAEEPSDVDPTAEIYESVDLEDAVIEKAVTDEEKIEENTSASKVFKFAQNEEYEEPEAPSPAPVAEPEPAFRSEAEEVEVTAAPDDLFDEQKVYCIPDPVEVETVARVAYESASVSTGVEDAPRDIGYNSSPKSKKKSEYTAYSQRDTIKDGFLDSIMSLRLRFFSALAVTALLLVSVWSKYIGSARTRVPAVCRSAP